MTAKEIREKETGSLENELREMQRHLFNLRSQAVTEKLEDPSQLGKARRDIARIKTILHQRQSKQQNDQKPTAHAAQPRTADANPQATPAQA